MSTDSHPGGKLQPVHLLALAILVLAFVLRLFCLYAQSFNADEIASMIFTNTGFVEVFGGGTGEPHPPLYQILLRGWVWLGGESEFAVRFLSVSLGLLSLAILFQLGRRLVGPRVGLLAVWVMTISPFHILYSQEARMYSLALFLSILSVYLLARVVELEHTYLWMGWAAATTAALLSHYNVIFVLLAEEVYLLVALTRKRKMPRRLWVVAHGVILAFLLPWVWYNQPFSSVYQTASQGAQLWPLLQQMATNFSVGQSLRDWQAGAATGFMLLLLALGLLYSGKWGRKGFLLIYLVLPIAAVYLLSVGRRDFNPKYLLIAAPPFYLLVACGLTWLKERSPFLLAGAAIALLLPSGISLHNYFYDPRFGRDDFRSLGRYLDDQVREGDVVIFNAPWGYEFTRYYSHRPTVHVGLPQDMPLSREKTVRELERLKFHYKRIWHVRWQDSFSDPGGFIEGWLEENASRTESKGLAFITTRTYVTPPALLSVPPIQNPLKVELEGRVRFLGFDLDKSEIASRRRFYVTLYWESLGPMDKSYYVYVHLENAARKLYGQKDNRPGYDTLPTDTWEKGMIVRDEYRVDIKLGAPPGGYQITVGIYDPANWEALEVYGTGRNFIPLGSIEIE